MSTDTNAPARHMSVIDAISVVVAIVVGSMIFKAPSWVASNTSGPLEMMLAWVAGGFFCLCGALCYAELAAAYPKVGGEYVYITRAFGRPAGFGFVWARATVIQTGSIAMLAYVFGEFTAPALGMGAFGPLILALAATVVLTACNVIGLRTEKWVQNALTIAKIGGVLAIAIIGLLMGKAGLSAAATTTAPAAGNPGWLGYAMVFVLLTFGGWNEAAYVAGELKGKRRNMLWVLMGSIALITVIYLLINLAYLRVLGFEGMRKYPGTLAAEAMRTVLGDPGAVAVTVLVAVSALAGMDGCMFTGSRAICALGEDFPAFRPLGKWHEKFKTPVVALLVQSTIAVVLIILPALGGWFEKQLGSGFDAAAKYTAPVFWAFLLLTAVSVVVLRFRDPDRERPFRVPGYPLTVILFAGMCAFMLYSSIDYAGRWAVIGLAVLLAGLPVYLIFCRKPA
ncbi:MAG: amino acid permease [Phycisphaerae bacterium]|nr:amino acid permease [Phycisphaerae bacterium]